MKTLTFTCAIAALTMGVFATDGTAPLGTFTWSAIGSWDYGKIADEGGIATLSGKGEVTATQDKNGLKLGGIDVVESSHARISGTETIQFTGNSSFVRSRNLAQDQQVLTLSVPIAAENLETRGQRVNFAVTPVVSGKLTLGAADNYFTAGTTTLPDVATKGAASIQYEPSSSGTMTIPSLDVASGRALVRVRTADSSVNIGSLSLAEGTFMALESKGGTSSLGSSVKVKVENGVATDAAVVVRDVLSPYNVNFAAYDATAGFVPEEIVAPASGDSTKVIGGDGAVTVPSTVTAAKGVVVRASGDSTTLTVNSDLQVEKGVIFNSRGYDQPNINGSGSIRFGGNHGYILGSMANSTYSNLGIPVYGTAGVTFGSIVGSTSYKTVIIRNAKAAQWTGPTHIVGVQYDLNNDSLLPFGGDVYISGGEGYYGGRLNFYGWTDTQSYILNQNFHLSGRGSNGANGVIGTEKNKTRKVTFTGSIALDGDSLVSAATQQSGFVFDCPISGCGSLELQGGQHELKGSVTSSGGLLISNASVIVKGSAASLGTGAFHLTADSSMLAQDRTSGLAFPDSVRSEGALAFRKSRVTFPGQAVVDSLKMDGTSVFVKNARFGSVHATGDSRISATDNASSVVFDEDEDVSVNAEISDGEGKLSLVKAGHGTLTLARAQSYTGSTTIQDGTLKLEGDVLSSGDVSVWIDETTLSVDGQNRVTEWRSKTGDVAFVTKKGYDAVTFASPTCTKTVNGRKVVTFEKSSRCALAMPLDGPRATMRSVFLVYRPTSVTTGTRIAGLFGVYDNETGNDYGCRHANDTENKYWECNAEVSNSMRNNGLASIYYEENAVNVMYTRLDEQIAQSATLGLSGESYASVHLALGWRYGNHSTFDGEIAELIAFSRELTTDEIKYVENYLAKKWGRAEELNPGAKLDGRVLPSTTELSFGSDSAVLDLNGTVQTVASLSGRGIIANTSEKPAILKVTGTCTFAGKIEGNVRLETEGAGTKDLSLEVADHAGLMVSGGSATVTSYEYQPPTEGLAVWCDASHAETVITNEKGVVTQWNCRAGRKEYLTKNDGGYSKEGIRYEPAGWGGKPCLRFGPTNALVTAKIACRTVIVAGRLDDDAVFKPDGSELVSKIACVWGLCAQDIEYRGNMQAGSAFRLAKNGAFPTISDATWNGSPELAPGNGQEFLFVTTCGDKYADSNWGAVGTPASGTGFALGKNMNSCFRMRIGEVLVYERKLTETEIADVSAYLKAKWIDSEGPFPSPQAFAEEAELAVANGATVDLSNAGDVRLTSLQNDGMGGKITGDVSIAGFVADAHGGASLSSLEVSGTLTILNGAKALARGFGNLPKTDRPLALSVLGGVVGDFTALELEDNPRNKWVWFRSGDSWGLERKNGIVLIVR